MLAVRYLALAALVVWLGGIVTLTLLTSPSGEELGQFDLLSYACGALIVICLFVMKFVGPPPAAFIPRLAVATAMLAVAIYGGVVVFPSAIPRLADVALGFILLFWYVRE